MTRAQTLDARPAQLHVIIGTGGGTIRFRFAEDLGAREFTATLHERGKAEVTLDATVSEADPTDLLVVIPPDVVAAMTGLKATYLLTQTAPTEHPLIGGDLTVDPDAAS